MKSFRFIILIVFIVAGYSYAGEIVDRTNNQVKDGIYTSIDKTYAIPVPEIPEDKVFLQCGEATKDISWVFVAGGAKERAMLISTKIRKGYPKDDRILERAASRAKFESMEEGRYLEDARFIGEKKGRIFQTVYHYFNAGEPETKTDPFTGEKKQVKCTYAGVSRYIVRGDFFYEFMRMTTVDPMVNNEKVFDRLAADLGVWMKGFILTDNSDAGLVSLVDSYKKKGMYLKNVFAPPLNDAANLAVLKTEREKAAQKEKDRRLAMLSRYDLHYELTFDEEEFKDRFPDRICHLSQMGVSSQPVKDKDIKKKDGKIIVSGSFGVSMIYEAESLFVKLKDETGVVFTFIPPELPTKGEWTELMKPKFVTGTGVTELDFAYGQKKDLVSRDIPERIIMIRYSMHEQKK